MTARIGYGKRVFSAALCWILLLSAFGAIAESNDIHIDLEVLDSDGRCVGKNNERIPVYTRQSDIPSQCAHVPVPIPAVPKTCTTDGLTEGTVCSQCNLVIKVQEHVPAGHGVLIPVSDKVNPTCVSLGKTPAEQCQSCYAILPAEDIPMIAHNPMPITESVNPTCVSVGKTAATQCQLCGRITPQMEIPMIAHNPMPVTESVNPTCVSVGKNAATQCQLCGRITPQMEIPMIAHVYVPIAEAIVPTCLSTGRTAGTRCQLCGRVESEPVNIAMLPHTYVNGYCTICGGQEIVVPTPKPTKPPVVGSYSESLAARMIECVNEDRAENGSDPVYQDVQLVAATRIRAKEIAELFSHTRPDGSAWWTVYSGAFAENIAYGYTTAESCQQGFMDSSGHRENLLRSGYTKIGVSAYTLNGVVYWVQLFGY